MKKHITAQGRAAEQRRRAIAAAVGPVFVSGGLQLSSADRAAYPNKVAREVRRLGGDQETVATARRWAVELVEEVEANPTNQGMSAARESAAACADTITARVHQANEDALTAEREALDPDQVADIVSSGVNPGGVRDRARRDATERGRGSHDGPPTEERRAVIEAVTGTDRTRRRARRMGVTGEEPTRTVFLDGTVITG